MKYKLIAIDIQNDFATSGGKHYTPKPSVEFLKKEIFPFLKSNNIKIAEIISDYRLPRPGDEDNSCNPGTWGYESVVPKELVNSTWIKCMNSPLWTRENIGDADHKPGLPYQDPERFGNWLQENIGNREDVIPVLFGLTIDCCVMSTAQELNWRGYHPIIIKEAVDHYSGDQDKKNQVLETPVSNWAKVIGWDSIKKELI